MQIKIIKRNNLYPTFRQWITALQLVPEKEQKLWIKDTLRDKRNLHIFGKFFFPHIIKGDEEVPQCHLDLIEELSNPKDSAIIFPRAHAKSTWEKIDTIHDVVYALEPVILYIANTISDAQNHFESIKQELESNEYLIDVYGNLVPPDYKLSKKWTNKHFETTTGINVVARGAGKGRGVNIKHNRPSKIIFDDIEDDEEVASPERRQKVHNWIYNVIFPSRSRERSKIKFVGTVISPLCEVLAFFKLHGGIFRKINENGVPIWPKYFPLDYQEDLKSKIGTRAFMQEFMNTPTDDSLNIIKSDWINNNFYEVLNRRDELQKAIVLDPQAGQKKGSDYYGLCVVGRYPGDRHRYFLRVQGGKATQLEQAALLVRTYQEEAKEGKVLVVGVEMLMTQVAVYQLILDWQAGRIDLPGVNNHNRNIPIIAVEPRAVDGGPLLDKTTRLQMHEAAWERGEIHLHVSMRAFGEKIVCFPAVEHDDDIDSGIYCLDLLNRGDVRLEKPKEVPRDQRPITAGLRGKVF